MVRVRGTRKLENKAVCKKLSGLLLGQKDLNKLKDMYLSLFNRSTEFDRVKLPTGIHIPEFLMPVVRHLFCHNKQEPLFHNGAGKLWVYLLLEMRRHMSELVWSGE